MASVLRVSLTGSMPSGEVWSVNPCWRPGGDDLPTDYATLLTIATAIDGLTIPTSVRALNMSGVTHDGCRVESRNVDGSLENVAEHRRSSPVSGSGSAPHPFQTSLVQSLRSTAAGASGRGRLYWPATSVALNNVTLRIDATALSTAAPALKQYLLDIENAIKVSLPLAKLAVWSRQQQQLHNVNRVQIGDVADVQRRRRDKAVESITSVAFP